MGLFDGLKYGKAASELELTVEQYKEFLQYQQSDELTIEEYRYYLKKYAGKKSMRWFIDQVLYAPTEQQKPKEPQVKKQEEKTETWMPKEQIEEEEIWQPEELDPKFTIETGVLLRIEIPEGCKKVVIPEGVTEITNALQEDEDYDARKNIELLKLPSTLKKIAKSGMCGFSALKSLRLPEGLEVIGSWGLGGSTSVKHWVLPSTIKYVGDSPFGDDPEVESYTILSSNAKLSCHALSPCYLKQVNIPRQLSYLEEYLKSQLVDGEYEDIIVNYIDLPASHKDLELLNPEFEIIDGVLESAYVPQVCKDIVIPEGVTKLKEFVFHNRSMERVVFPSTMRGIDGFAFYGCKQLKEVILPENVAYIYNSAFFNCKGLEKVQLPSGIEVIDAYAFQNCENLKSIVLPERLKRVIQQAFGGCKNLRSIELLCINADVDSSILAGVSDVTITMPYAAHKIGEKLRDPSNNIRIVYSDTPEVQFVIHDGIVTDMEIPLTVDEVIIPLGITGFALNREIDKHIRSIVFPESCQKICCYCTDTQLTVLNPHAVFTEGTLTTWKTGWKKPRDLYLPEQMREQMSREFMFIHYMSEARRERLIYEKYGSTAERFVVKEEKLLAETPRRRRRQQMPEAQPDTQMQEMTEQPTVQPVNSDSVEETPVTERRRRRRQSVLPDTNQVTDVEMLKEANEALVAEEPATVETQAAKPAGVLYAVGQEPDDIRERLERLFEKLDSAYPDKVIVALTKNHGYWAETVTELYRLLGYPDSWSFLEAYGYQVKVNEENGKGGRPVKDRTAVIDELKRRYPQPVEGNVAFLMEQNPDLAPRIKTLQNSAQTVFGMRLADYLRQEGILAEKKVETKIEKPVVKQLTPEEKLEQIISELKRRYPTLKSAPKSLAELKEKNADLPIATLNTLTQKVVQKTAGEYCLELGLICDKERMKKAALESAADGRDGWGRQFTQTILDRGVNMFVAGEVKSLARTADGYAAKVKGTSMYSVNIGVSGDEVRSMSCTCPYAADGLNCKHMAAVLFEANAKLYAPKVKKPQPVYGHATNVVSRSCADNEILIVSKDEAVLREAVNCSYIDSDRVSIHPCSENPAYYLCEVRIDERRINLCGLMDKVICPAIDGRGVALGRKVDNEHEVSEIGFYDGECLWAGSEFDLMYPDSDAPDEPEEWVYECNSKKNRTWGQSKKVWKKIWNKIPYYKVSDLIATYEENCMAALTSAKESSKVSRDADRRCEPGELLIVSNYYDGIEQIVYEQEEIEPKNGICQCLQSPEGWYAVFDLNACEDIQETLNALLDMVGGGMIFLARWKDENGDDRVWFFDSDGVWTDMLEADLTRNNDPREAVDRHYQGIFEEHDEAEIEAMWRDMRGKLLKMTVVDWARFIDAYCPDEDE